MEARLAPGFFFCHPSCGVDRMPVSSNAAASAVLVRPAPAKSTQPDQDDGASVVLAEGGVYRPGVERAVAMATRRFVGGALLQPPYSPSQHGGQDDGASVRPL